MKDDAIFEIMVTPKSSRSLVKLDGDIVRVFLHSPPADGKANKECVEVLAKKLKVAKSRVSIERGARGRTKRIAVQGMTLPEVLCKLGE